MINFDIDKSIENHEGDYWGKIPNDASGLIKSCYSLRTEKIRDLDENDIRIALGQNIGLPYTVPLAIEMLKESPLIEALYYEGDLLKNLLLINSSYWDSNVHLKKDVLDIIKNARIQMDSIDMTDDIKEELGKVFMSFE